MISIHLLRPRLLLTAAACTWAAWTFCSEAQAQIKPTIQAIDKTQIRRQQALRGANDYPYWVSRADCLADDVITFRVQVTSPNTDQFEVWAGTADCSQKTERQGTTANCWRVYSKTLVKSPADIQISAQTFVAARSITNVASSTAGEEGDCEPKSQNAGLYFMYINDSGDVSSNSVKFSETGIDTEGPITPEVTELLPSDGRLIVNWASNNPTEFAGYRLYCTDAVETESVESALTLADSTSGESSAADTASSGTASLGGSTSSASDTGSVGLASGESNAPGSVTPSSGAPSDAGVAADAAAGDTGSMGVPGCGGSVLVEGRFPPSSALCGEVSSFSATTGYAKDLTNGRSYAVGVTAVDRLGNESYLSNVVCNSPREVYTFYEDYKDAGGGGGGGFCSLTTTGPHSRNGGYLWGLASFAICLGLFRRINNT